MPRFFHIDRTNALSEGQELGLTTWTALPANKKIPDSALQDHIEELFPDGVSAHGMGYLFWQRTFAFPAQPGFYDAAALDTMRSHMIDILFEYVRRASFRERPSRYRSIFAWASLEDAQRFAASTGTPGVAVWELEGSSVFEADMNLLGLGLPLTSSLAAWRYWSGEAKHDVPPHWEHFLEPGARVCGRVA